MIVTEGSGFGESDPEAAIAFTRTGKGFTPRPGSAPLVPSPGWGTALVATALGMGVVWALTRMARGRR